MISSIRINDVWLLLGIGIIYEGLCRFYLLWNCKLKSNTLLRKEVEYQQLQQQITQQKKLGPSSFVTTSKLERQSLQYDKELQIIYEQRKKYVFSLVPTVCYVFTLPHFCNHKIFCNYLS